MAIKAYHLDKRTLKTPSGGTELAQLENTLNLKEYVVSIIAGAPILAFPDGTAAAPGITFQGDTDTGFYLGGNNILDFSVGGVKTFDIRTNQVTVKTGANFLVDNILESTLNSGVNIDHVLLKDGGISSASGVVKVGFYPFSNGEQTLSGAGAISTINYHTKWTTTAADAATLADGLADGQLKKITLVTDGGDGTLTCANSYFTTATFTTAGDYLVLIFDIIGGWQVLENSGVTIA